MGKNRSLFQQFNYAINNNFFEGTDKHADKKENGSAMQEKIYSYTSLNNLKDFAKNFSNFTKENYPEVRNINDVKEEHLQGFLNQKNTDGCTQNTLDMYKNNFNKLENVVNSTFKTCNWDYKDKVVTPTSQKQYDPNRGAANPISKGDLDKILDYCKENRSGSGDALITQAAIGVRVEELAQLKVKNVDLENGKLHLDNTKGGKAMERTITDDIRDILKENIEGKDPEEKVFGVASSSINKQLNRIQDKLGLDKHSNHDIRRRLAQNKFNECRNAGLSKQEALDTISKWLNHGANRNDLLAKSYVANIW